jgi:Flp pilus assembly protein TadG
MKNQKGQALVEFALILPLLLLLLFGVFEFGRAMFIKNTLNNAARAAARVAVVTPKLTDITYDAGNFSAPSTSTPVDNIQVKIYDSLFSIDKSKVTAQVDIVGRSGTETAQYGDTVTITVICDFESIVSKITSTLRINLPNKLQGQASMRYE